MLKKIALALVIAIPATASANRRVYDIKATRVEPIQDVQSCGASARMLKDKHILVIDEENDVVAVDGQRWRVHDPEPDLRISFHADHGQKTWLSMDFYVNQRGLSGRYLLKGVIPDRDDPRKYEICLDAVYLDGTRR